MNADEPSREQGGEDRQTTRPPTEISRLHARWHDRRRRRHLARVDLVVGVLAAVVLLVASPGLAIAGLIALLLLALCLLTLALEWRGRSDRRDAPR